jgi:hypothetical protein
VNPELVEQFFKGYLDENKLKYSMKSNVYRVELDKTHQKWYNLQNLKCTFDPLSAKKEFIELIQPGNFIFDSMVSRYGDEVVVSNLKIYEDKQDLIKVNEKLEDLGKKGIKYNISEEQDVGSYILFEVTVNTANHTQRFSLPLLVMGKKTISAENFAAANFVLVEDKFKVEGVEQALGQITKLIGTDLKKAEKEHNKDMKELIEIQRQHAENQYYELQKEEDKILNKVDELENKAVEVSSFSTKDKLIHQAKSLKKKHKKLAEKNKTKRKEIESLFDKQIEELKTRELNVEAKVLALAKLDFPYFSVKFDDAEEFHYFSFLEKFEKNKKS